MTAPNSSDAIQSHLFTGRGVSCRRGGKRVFDQLDFTLDAGQALLLRGANGVGKTSLLRLMAGLLPPAGGTICWQGQSVHEALGLHARRLCYVGHRDALKPTWSLARNLTNWAKLTGGDGYVAAALERLDIGALGDVPVARLSRGQARRGALARLALAPRTLWLLDEPTASLDEPSSALVCDMIAQHCAAGGLAVVATHRPLDLPNRAAIVEMRLDMSAQHEVPA